MKKYLLVYLFGMLGGICRLCITQIGVLNNHFPLGTLLVNLSGCLVFPIIKGYIAGHFDIPNDVVQGVSVGFIGAFTTFSSFSFDSFRLFQSQMYMFFLTYNGISIIGGLLCILLGITISKILLSGRVTI